MLKRQTTETLKKTASSAPATANLEQEPMVQALAYELWVQRGCPVGSDQEDWFEAERQLRTAQSLAA